MQSYIFPALQILQFGCNQAICSWTANQSQETSVGRTGRKQEEGRSMAHPQARAKGLPRFGKVVSLIFVCQDK